MRPRYRRRSLSSVTTIILLLILIAARWWSGGEPVRTDVRNDRPHDQINNPQVQENSPDSRDDDQQSLVGVKRVVDGDTLLLDNGERVRLLGIDTPESVKPDTPPEPWGPEASEFTKRMAEGRQVRLEFDTERVDQYGRTLAYVYVDDLLLNEEIVRQGYSRAETRFRFRSDFKQRFLAAEQEARNARRGIWSGEKKTSPKTNPAR